MQLSVVIPVYNGARFIEDAVKSIYDQTFLPEHSEIILIEDGSSDNSHEVCQCLAAQHHEIKVLSHEVNKGVAAARNLGIQIAGGDYLAMLDQDDTWHPNKLERQFQVFQDDPSVELVLGLQEFHLVGTDNFPRWFKPAWADAPQPGYVFGCMLTRKSTFLKVGVLDESLKFGNDDVDWFGRAKSLGVREVLLNEVVLLRKIHGSNTSQNQRFNANAELLQVIRRKIGRS